MFRVDFSFFFSIEFKTKFDNKKKLEIVKEPSLPSLRLNLFEGKIAKCRRGLVYPYYYSETVSISPQIIMW